MTTYTVIREFISGRDGDEAFATLEAAQADFNDTSSDDRVVSVQLWSNDGEPQLVAERKPS
jgi:hypothetical protein